MTYKHLSLVSTLSKGFFFWCLNVLETTLEDKPGGEGPALRKRAVQLHDSVRLLSREISFHYCRPQRKAWGGRGVRWGEG